MTDNATQRTLNEFQGPPNAPEEPQCRATADHSGERCERVASVADLVCPYHIDKLDEFTEGLESTTVAADGGTSIPRRTGHTPADD